MTRLSVTLYLEFKLGIQFKPDQISALTYAQHGNVSVSFLVKQSRNHGSNGEMFHDC
jgi:hypothetical protein